MHRAVDPGQPAMDEGLALASIQVSPNSFLGMIVEWTPFPTMRALPNEPLDLLDPDIHAVFSQIQHYLIYVPGMPYPQQGRKQFFDIFHRNLLILKLQETMIIRYFYFCLWLIAIGVYLDHAVIQAPR
jgi:hypothetical protein